MVDVITPTKTWFCDGKTPVLKLTFAGFDAATEYGIFDAWSECRNFAPKNAIAIVTRTAGSQNTIDVDVDVAMENTNYVATSLNNITAKDTYGYHPEPDFGEADNTQFTAWRYWKVYIVDEGNGNTLTVTLWLF